MGGASGRCQWEVWVGGASGRCQWEVWVGGASGRYGLAVPVDEVALKVHLSDASTHQPLSGVTVEIFANHTPVAKEISGEDGNIFIRIHYRLGDLLVVTATRRGYVPSSSPWRPARLPVFSSLSLDLLPERTATLMVYDDIVQIVAGYQGSRQQPWVQFPRRALHLPPNTTYTNLTALLTVSHSGQDTQRFPYLQGLPSNGSDWFELTPIAAISVHLLGSDGVELHVNEPVSVSVPLPANSGLDENDHVPAWRFDPKLGAWLKISLGNVHRDGAALTLTYIAPQLGYWVAAMSPINTAHLTPDPGSHQTQSTTDPVHYRPSPLWTQSHTRPSPLRTQSHTRPSLTPDPVHYGPSLTPDPVHYRPSLTPDPVSHQTQSTMDPVHYRPSPLWTQSHTRPSLTPDPVHYGPSLTPDPVHYRPSLTPDPVSHQTQSTMDPVHYRPSPLRTQSHTRPSLTPDPVHYVPSLTPDPVHYGPSPLRTQSTTDPVSHQTQSTTDPVHYRHRSLFRHRLYGRAHILARPRRPKYGWRCLFTCLPCPVVAKDISTYHTVFLLAILGGMAIILLFLLCLLLYYCRRKCVRSRRTHQKFALSSSLDGSKRDQATSMSHLNLISETRLDHVGAEPDLHTPMLKTGHYDTSTNELLTSQDELQSRASDGERHRRSAETFALRSARSTGPSEGFDSPAQRGDYRRSYSSTISSSPHPLRTSVPPSNPHLLHHAASAGRLSSDSRAGELRLSPAAATPVTPAASPCRDRETILERRPADYLLSRSVDHLERPAALPRPGALLCCTSELQVSQGEATYQKARPTLLIPAHYIRLPGTHPLSGQALLLQSDEQSELESIQAELNASRKPQGEAGQGDGGGGLGEGREGEAGARPAEEWTLQTAALPEALSIPNSLSQAGLGVVQMNGEDQLLAEKTLMELRGGKPLPHPRAWFVSLDGRSNAHIRHSYIDLQRAGHSASSAWSNDASLDSGVDVSDVTPGRRARNLSKGQERARPAAPPAAYTQLVFVEGAKAGRNADAKGAGNADAKAGGNADANAKAGGNADASGPEDGSLGCLLTSAVREEAEEESLTPPSPPGPSVKGDGVQRGGQDQTLRTERAQTGPPLSPSDGGQGDMAPPDDSGEDENKKSPWQKREERPLLAFNLK
ncbi:hypothetical protein P4O66_005185 [Electrophorus voltai]|uniref:Family with sequence similarity 171 member A1 n=1 Tax=Electrophorus voltai TaxID=2609070 RepID=A0AAD9E4A3_9TELE|nr:hypothetical protein P4O66_005185 [Electrophorus voltai]